MKSIHSESIKTTSVLRKRNLKILNWAVFKCQNCANYTKQSLNFLQTNQICKSKFVQSKRRFLKFAVFPLIFLIALSCCAPTVGARTTAYLRSPTTANSTLETSFHENVSSPTKKLFGLRALPPRHRVPKILRKRSKKTKYPPKRNQKIRSIKPRKMRRRKTKGKGRKQKRCKKKRKNCKKRKNKKKKKKNGSWGATKMDSTIRRMYSKLGNSFHLAVLQNGTVRGEPSHIRSDYS